MREAVGEARIEQFVASEYPRVVRALTQLCGSRAAAEDVVQDALVRAWERLERGRDIETLGAWVTTAALNLARSGLRRRAAERRAHDRVLARRGHDEPRYCADDAIDLRHALARLPRRQQEATVLHYYLGFDVKTVAQMMSVTSGTVKSNLYDARRSLSAALASVEIEGERTDVGEDDVD